MSKTHVLKTWLGIAFGLMLAIGGGARSLAAGHPAASTGVDAGDQGPNPPQRTLSPGPFHGDWSVTTDDGTMIVISLRQLTGGLRNTVSGTVTPQALTIVRGFAANRTSLHLTVSMAGQKGDMVLTLAPNGKSFTGTGQLADGTAITWIGRQASSAAAGTEPPQTRQVSAGSRQTRQAHARQAASADDASQQVQQTIASSEQTAATDDASALQTDSTDDSSPQTRQSSAPPQQAESADDASAMQDPSPTTPRHPAQSSPRRSASSASFHGNWNVSADDGTTFALNFRQGKSSLGKKLLHEITGGQQNNIAGSATPAVLKVVNGSLVNKIYLHLTVSMSGQKGDVMLTLAPDGNSFTGAGQLVDGTAIAWTGQRASPDAQNQATDTSRSHSKIDRLRKEISESDQPT